MTDSDKSADRVDDQLDPAQTETDSDTTESGTADPDTTDSGTADSDTTDADTTEVIPAAPAGKKQRAARTDTARAAAASTAPAPTPAATPAPSGGKQVSFTVTGRSVLLALLSLVTIAALVGCGVLGWMLYSERERAQAFDDSKAASEEFVTKLVSTLNSGSASQYKEIIGPLSTGKLRDRLEQERTDTEKSVEDLKLEATSKIVSSSVDSYSTDSAKTVVMAEVTGRSATAPSGATNLMVFLVDLQKVDGNWLVSEFNGPPGTEASGMLDGSQMPGTTGTTGQTTTPAQAPAATETATPAPAPGG